MILTNKQLALMEVIVKGNEAKEGEFFAPHCDIDQIIERVFYHPSKHALQFSIRKLISKGLIEKAGMERRRDRRRILIAPTKLGKMLFETKKTEQSYIESADEIEEI